MWFRSVEHGVLRCRALDPGRDRRSGRRRQRQLVYGVPQRHPLAGTVQHPTALRESRGAAGRLDQVRLIATYEYEEDSTMGPTGQTRVVQIHPTRRCNLRCLLCFSSSSPVVCVLLVNTLLCNALSDAAAAGYNWASISGGEPLMYPQLATLLRHARSAGMQTAIATNGMLLDARRAADGVVGSGYAVDADRDEVGDVGDGIESARIQQHAVGGNGGLHAGAACMTQQCGKLRIHQRLAARDAGPFVARRRRIAERVAEQRVVEHGALIEMRRNS